MNEQDIEEIYAELEAEKEARRSRPAERHINARPKKAPYPDAELADLMLERIPYPILGDVKRVFGSRNKPGKTYA